MIKDGRAELIGMHISPYNKGGLFNPDARRNRALLLNKREILKLKSSVETKGYTIVPVKLYFRQALVKVEIGLAKGKNLYDKRQSIKEKQIKRETERDIKKLTE
jgi:SsrA-binding protein